MTTTKMGPNDLSGVAEGKEKSRTVPRDVNIGNVSWVTS